MITTLCFNRPDKVSEEKNLKYVKIIFLKYVRILSTSRWGQVLSTLESCSI